VAQTRRAGRRELLKRLEEMEKEEPSGQAAEWAAVRAFKPEGFKLLVKEAQRNAYFLAGMV